MSQPAEVCAHCKRPGEPKIGLKIGWTRAMYCSQQCERAAVSQLHDSMPGGPNPYPGWLPYHIAREIADRWEQS